MASGEKNRKALTKPVEVKLRADVLARLEDQVALIPTSPRGGAPRRLATPEEEAIVRKYWGVKPISRLALVIGISDNTLRRWARDWDLIS